MLGTRNAWGWMTLEEVLVSTEVFEGDPHLHPTPLWFWGLTPGLTAPGAVRTGPPPPLPTPHLVEVPLLLVQGGGQGVGSVHVDHQVLHLRLQPLLGLLQGRALRIHCLHLLLGILEALSQLFP